MSASSPARTEKNLSAGRRGQLAQSAVVLGEPDRTVLLARRRTAVVSTQCREHTAAQRENRTTQLVVRIARLLALAGLLLCVCAAGCDGDRQQSTITRAALNPRHLPIPTKASRSSRARSQCDRFLLITRAGPAPAWQLFGNPARCLVGGQRLLPARRAAAENAMRFAVSSTLWPGGWCARHRFRRGWAHHAGFRPDAGSLGRARRSPTRCRCWGRPSARHGGPDREMDGRAMRWFGSYSDLPQ